jgi:hypothetical protein
VQQESQHNEKIRLLTLAPLSWSRKQCSEYFDVPENKVKLSRTLRKTLGILPSSQIAKQGCAIAEETVKKSHNVLSL